MKGIVFSTDQEAAPFLEHYQRGRFEGLNEGDIAKDQHILVALTGTGKIKATLHTERILQRTRLERLIHIGLCTPLSTRFQPGTLVGISQVFEGDRIELAAPVYPRMPLEIPFKTLPEATLVTQDYSGAGNADQGYWQRIADASDMVGYPIAYVTATHGVPCHIVKIMTRKADASDPAVQKALGAVYRKMADFLLSEVV